MLIEMWVLKTKKNKKTFIIWRIPYSNKKQILSIYENEYDIKFVANNNEDLRITYSIKKQILSTYES
jgi:hypothetical protein